MKRQTYVAPDVTVVEVNSTDVISTSKFILDAVGILAGETSFTHEWMEKLKGMEGVN